MRRLVQVVTQNSHLLPIITGNQRKVLFLVVLADPRKKLSFKQHLIDIMPDVCFTINANCYKWMKSIQKKK